MRIGMLTGVGITPDAEIVYLTLLDAPSASAADVAARCRPGTPVEGVLAELVARGLVSVLPGQPPRYQPAPPDLALEALVRGREQELQAVRLTMTELADRYHASRLASHADNVIEVVYGAEATLQRWEQLQRAAREQVRAFDRPPYVGGNLRNPAEEDMLRAGVSYRVAYQLDGYAVPGRPEAIRALIASGEKARVATDLPVKMFIADNRIGLLPLEFAGAADSCLIIHASSLLDSLIALFELVWSRAVPVHADGSPPMRADTTTPSDEDMALLGLLAAGLTDAAIARQLGTHLRTAQRRVRDLLDKLGAASRFQAGLQAARRGWL